MMNSKTKILLVEDNKYMGDLLCDSFLAENYDVHWETNGMSGWKAFMTSPPDICILDIMVPGIDGIELAKRIKKHKAVIPIIFLTARSLKSDVITGYETGCDDYIIKPFEEFHLLLKVKALLARTQEKKEIEPSILHIGNFKLNVVQRQIIGPNGNQRINRLENHILKILMKAEQNMVSRDHILETVWGRNDIYTSKSLDTYLYKIRKYLNKSNLVLENIYGSGYLLRTAD